MSGTFGVILAANEAGTQIPSPRVVLIMNCLRVNMACPFQAPGRRKPGRHLIREQFPHIDQRHPPLIRAP